MSNPTDRPISPPKRNMSAPQARAGADVFPEHPAATDAHPATQPASRPVEMTPPTITIHARIEGFAFDVAFVGKIEQLSAYLDRLRSAGATPASAAEWAYTPEGLPICPKHGAPMKRREKQGDTWYSHVVTAPDGEDIYCRGYHGKDSPGFEC